MTNRKPTIRNATMRNLSVILISLCSTFLSRPSGAASGGSLTGTVVDDHAVPVPGALVSYRSVPAFSTGPNGRPAPNGPTVSAVVKTAADGTFAISGLPSAVYHLCAIATRSTQLGSCEWTQGTTQADLTVAQSVSGLRLEIDEGTIVTFQVEDPKHQIRDLADFQQPRVMLPLTGGNFAVGIFAGRRYLRATLVSTNANSRTYQLAIPKTATVRLFLDTSLRVADVKGASVSTAQRSTAIAANGQDTVTVHLSIP
jgi:hypothetical protein